MTCRIICHLPDPESLKKNESSDLEPAPCFIHDLSARHAQAPCTSVPHRRMTSIRRPPPHPISNNTPGRLSSPAPTSALISKRHVNADKQFVQAESWRGGLHSIGRRVVRLTSETLALRTATPAAPYVRRLALGDDVYQYLSSSPCTTVSITLVKASHLDYVPVVIRSVSGVEGSPFVFAAALVCCTESYTCAMHAALDIMVYGWSRSSMQLARGADLAKFDLSSRTTSLVFCA
ncbi:uncharacterized protein EI97DRAFT_192852 [Westerdykella ornata]|uniref:Uncharacterized protein n=1 Tax=Westerdykella ornata TaxID=318751 RepID=A0A6A6J8X1_WESOR|nr:uncharacterized protein EI97DRAFT_192852 [Westerdykella ornata]KAF2273021.1 hypothetical protein EI97DRAFT_192852 [Westerdykella ornata]